MNKETDTKLVPTLVITLAVMIAGTLFVIREPLQSRRPQETAPTLQDAASDEVTLARLWQDPLSAIQSHWRQIATAFRTSGAPPPLSALPPTIGQIAQQLEYDRQQLRLIIPLPNDGYASTIEQRRRQRYALVSALTDRDFVPDEAEHIGYFVAPRFRTGTRVSGDTPTLVGYERYRPAIETEPAAQSGNAYRWKSVLVLWLSASDFADYPLHQIAALMTALDDRTDTAVGNTTVLLGPNTSGDLRRIWQTAPNLVGMTVAEDFIRRAQRDYSTDAIPFLHPAGETPAEHDLPLDRIGMVLERIDEYLDFGLPEQATDELYYCLYFDDDLGQNSLAECLNTATFRTISDSDAKWRASVAAMWGPTLHDVVVPSPPHVDVALQDALDLRRQQLHIVSTRATVPYDRLFRDTRYRGGTVDQQHRAELHLRDDLRVHLFRSVLVTDELVLRDILLELKARGLCHRETAALAIVSEQDTVYGRVLDDIIADVVTGWADDTPPCTPRVYEFGYLRGVDGELPSGPSHAAETHVNRRPATAAGNVRASDVLLPQPDPESAAGPAQLDYIRRLADTIKYREAKAGGFAAIGILGSDVYDKELILQALRSRLPGAVFFTTDLDTRWIAPESNRWTRNLLVGSAYGLAVEQQDGAGFRDSYQTALYQAVHLALELPDEPELWAPAPRLYEIARSGPVDITNYPPECDRCALSAEIHSGIRYVEPYRGWRAQVVSTGFLLLPLIGLTAFAFTAAKQAFPDRRTVAHRALLGLSWTGFAATGILGSLLWFWPGHEPWLLFEGVSTVPGLVLQLTTTVFAVGILIYSVAAIAREDADISHAYGWSDASGPRIGWRMVRGVARWRRELDTHCGATLDAHDAWRRYRRLGKLPARMVRTAVPFFSWTLVFIVVVQLDPTPLVSHELHEIADIVHCVALIAVIAAVCFCCDALHLAQVTIRALSMQNVVGWPAIPEHEGLADDVSARWHAMNLIVRCTEAVRHAIILPFGVVSLLLLARSTVFEGWTWTTVLLLVYGAFAAYILLRALLFQREAAAARQRILADLARHEHVLVSDDEQRQRLRLVMREIDGLKRGAFVPWTRHPLFQSLALPSGGLGLVTLLGSML